ncbi:TetR/AcrR family transcriptional regulator [Planobispora siamensis]|uniref:TetR family transcriptional regulator n=1 Tax=Planobispora siamensis TaxID=936338 RepID=A0A8J3WMZ9_9ACTN|nr:TetR/AcrR family transcriptional regulator [Planobispora siamensis]GIH93962.1 TetR family transcriptional regulator [Planobispora siamensis]
MPAKDGAVARRTQAERSSATSSRLLATAEEMFGRDGYAATSLAAVAAAAGMTKGAAYHHFPGKAGLFREVFVRRLRWAAAALERVAVHAPDPWSALREGCRTFLECCTDPGFRQIVLLDGPAVLGWDAVREIEYEHLLRVLRDGMRAAAAEGWIAGGDLDVRSQLVFGALCEAGMMLARSPDPEGVFPAVAGEAERLLGALVRG